VEGMGACKGWCGGSGPATHACSTHAVSNTYCCRSRTQHAPTGTTCAACAWPPTPATPASAPSTYCCA
jgi:hypothetical protein